MPNVEIKASADYAGVVAAYDTMLRKQQESINKLKETARESREAGRHTVGLGDVAVKAAGDIGKMAAAYLTVGTAVSLLRRELAETRTLNQEIIHLNESIAQPAGRATRSTTILFAPAELQRLATEIAVQTGMGEKEIFSGFAEAGKIGQRIGANALTEAVTTAARIVATFGGDVAEISKGLAQGAEAAQVSPEAIAGYLLRQFPAMNLDELMPGLVSATAAGATPEETVEFTKFFERASPKIRGGAARLSADFFQQLMQEHVFPVEEVSGGRVTTAFRSLAEIAPEAQGVAEALRVYRASLAAISPEERERALGPVLVGQGGAKAMLRNLLIGEAGAGERMAEIQRSVLAPSEADRARVMETVGAARQLPSVGMAAVEAQHRIRSEVSKLLDTPQAFEEEALQSIDDVLREGRAGILQRTITGGIARLAIKTPDEAIGAMEALAEDIHEGRGRGMTGGLPVPFFQGVAPMSDERSKVIESTLLEQVRVMKEMLQEQRRTNAAFGQVRAVIPYGEN